MSEKMAKRVRRLEGRVDDLERFRSSWDAAEEAAHNQAVLDSATERNAAHRRAREAERAVVAWRRMTYAILVAAIIVLVAAILVVNARADDTPSNELMISDTETMTHTENTAKNDPIFVMSLSQTDDSDKVAEDFENERIEAALLARANVIEDCEVTWYTEDTCGKTPDDPAYGITRSGLPVVEHLTCAVDPNVIPLYSDVFVEYADGTIEQLWATDTGVKGNSLDIYTPDYDYAIQCGRQRLTVWWVWPED